MISSSDQVKLRQIIGTRYDCYNHIIDALRQFVLDEGKEHAQTVIASVMASKIQKK